MFYFRSRRLRQAPNAKRQGAPFKQVRVITRACNHSEHRDIACRFPLLRHLPQIISYPSIHPSIHPSVRLLVCLSVSIRPSVRQTVGQAVSRRAGAILGEGGGVRGVGWVRVFEIRKYFYFWWVDVVLFLFVFLVGLLCDESGMCADIENIFRTSPGHTGTVQPENTRAWVQ